MILPLADARWRHTTWYPGVLCGALFQRGLKLCCRLVVVLDSRMTQISTAIVTISLSCVLIGKLYRPIPGRGGGGELNEPPVMDLVVNRPAIL